MKCTVVILSLFVWMQFGMHAAAQRDATYNFAGGRFGDNILSKFDSKNALREKIHELIIQKKYGPELAQELDTLFAQDGYFYEGNGFYAEYVSESSYKFPERLHSLPRHLCEPGIDAQEAERTNEAWHKRRFPPANTARELVGWEVGEGL